MPANGQRWVKIDGGGGFPVCSKAKMGRLPSAPKGLGLDAGMRWFSWRRSVGFGSGLEPTVRFADRLIYDRRRSGLNGPFLKVLLMRSPIVFHFFLSLRSPRRSFTVLAICYRPMITHRDRSPFFHLKPHLYLFPNPTTSHLILHTLTCSKHNPISSSVILYTILLLFFLLCLTHILIFLFSISYFLFPPLTTSNFSPATPS